METFVVYYLAIFAQALIRPHSIFLPVRYRKNAKFDFLRDDYLKIIEKTVLQTVADISEAHTFNTADVYGFKSKAKSDLLSVKYMMIILRLADTLDMTMDRIDYYLLKENIKQMDAISQFHWISHLITNNCDIYSTYTVDEPPKDGSFLTNGSIEEIITIEIDLNAKNLTLFTNKTACVGCEIELDKTRKQIKFAMTEKDKQCGKFEKCTFLCKWMQMKHLYLFQELMALKQYLKIVNNSLFNTKIQVVVNYSNARKLDQEFFDSVNIYLNNSNTD